MISDSSTSPVDFSLGRASTAERSATDSPARAQVSDMRNTTTQVTERCDIRSMTLLRTRSHHYTAFRRPRFSYRPCEQHAAPTSPRRKNEARHVINLSSRPDHLESRQEKNLKKM